MTPLSSSNLSGCAYEEQTRTLTITFRSGDTWSYSGVGKEVYEDLLRSSSPGQYFARHIKNQYVGSQE